MTDAATAGAAEATHRRLFARIAPAAVLALAVWQPGPEAQLALLVPLVAVLGLPHGALDREVAALVYPLEGARGQILFAAGYLGLAGAVAGLWVIAPGPALAAFVAYSAVHFATDWRGEGPWPVPPALGVLVVGAPTLLHGDEVARVFALIATPGAAAAVLPAMQGAGLAALALVAARLRHLPRGLLAEAAILLAAGLLLPPLLYFTLYFCGLHSPRHFLGTVQGLGLSPAGGARAALPATVATFAMAAAGGALWWGAGLDAEATLLRAVFVTLAALTVPHMWLVERRLARRGG